MASALSAAYFHDEAAAFAELEATLWPHGPVCPRCGGLDRITRVRGARMGLRRCGPCKRQFTVTVGTVFESSHVPLKPMAPGRLFDVLQQEGHIQPSN